MVKKLYLLRHGRVDTGGRYIGSTDLPLLPAGREEIRTIGSCLRRHKIDSVLCSPLLRCRQTLAMLDIGGIPETICEDLREIDFGAWEGLTFAEIVQRNGQLVEDWANWSEEFSFPGGEGIAAFLARVRQVQRWIDEQAGSRILVVSHGGVIRQLICLYLGLSPDKHLLFAIQTGLYSVIDLHSKGGILAGLNLGS